MERLIVGRGREKRGKEINKESGNRDVEGVREGKWRGEGEKVKIYKCYEYTQCLF